MKYQMELASNGSRSWVSTGSEWEKKIGYSRAVKTGHFVFVSGTVGKNVDGSMPDDLINQTKNSLTIISEALSRLDSSIEKIVKLNIFMEIIYLPHISVRVSYPKLILICITAIRSQDRKSTRLNSSH